MTVLLSDVYLLSRRRVAADAEQDVGPARDPEASGDGADSSNGDARDRTRDRIVLMHQIMARRRSRRLSLVRGRRLP